MAIRYRRRLSLALAGLVVLSACTNGASPFNFGKKSADAPAAAAGDRAVKLVERDVEAPEAFQVTDAGLWDGRPSLGGVWVAHADAKDPERVIIRNQDNGKFVIGALFHREIATPGPRFQISSDAAAALGILAGQPAQLNVTALRREEVPDPAVKATTTALAAPGPIETKALDPIASAAAALDKVEAKAAGTTTESAPATASATTTAPATAPQTKAAASTAPKPKPQMTTAKAPAKSASAPTRVSALAKPWIQIGIFNVEANARRTADNLRKVGIVPVVKNQTSQGKPFWRVLVGPATNAGERKVLLGKVRDIGFADAYFVTN